MRAGCRPALFKARQTIVLIELGWAKRWRSKGWVVKSGDKAANPDLWQRLLDLCETHVVKFRWLKGHAGHEENETCDRLSVAACTAEDLEVDEPFELIHKSA